MIKLDNDLLTQLGLGALPQDEKKKLLAHVYETLEMRVGVKLAEQMTDAQLDEFEQFIGRNDESGALRWLESNFPNYKDVVASEFEKLKREIAQVAPQILAASMGGARVPQSQAQMPAQQWGQQPAMNPAGMPPQQAQYTTPQPQAPQGYAPNPQSSYYPQPAPGMQQQPGSQVAYPQPQQPAQWSSPPQQPAQQIPPRPQPQRRDDDVDYPAAA
ncbi:MAG TPA: DUF5663 domain-containing protein [Candidatus Saccharimonadales bacterium]|jgi:hypothetical protein|nr:DUF5663 domain-containing protein [Candidatus Saccharimonadales bacterium]